MEELFYSIARVIAVSLEAAAVLIVTLGAIDALVKVFAALVRRTATHGDWKVVWRRFGVWILMALEFELAADIVRSVLSPTWQDIGQLAAIALPSSTPMRPLATPRSFGWMHWSTCRAVPERGCPTFSRPRLTNMRPKASPASGSGTTKAD